EFRDDAYKAMISAASYLNRRYINESFEKHLIRCLVIGDGIHRSFSLEPKASAVRDLIYGPFRCLARLYFDANILPVLKSWTLEERVKYQAKFGIEADTKIFGFLKWLGMAQPYQS